MTSKITVDSDYIHKILKDACSLKKITMKNLDSVLKSRDITLLTKVCSYSQSYGFPSSHVQM